MKQEFDLVIGQDGSIGAIYQDGLAEALGATTSEVRRASTVEWETTTIPPYAEGEEPTKLAGWVVRSIKDPDVCIRMHPCYDDDPEEDLFVSREEEYRGMLARPYYFPTREKALEAEVKFFWSLLMDGPCRIDEECDNYCFTHFCGPDSMDGPRWCLKEGCPHCESERNQMKEKV